MNQKKNKYSRRFRGFILHLKSVESAGFLKN